MHNVTKSRLEDFAVGIGSSVVATLVMGVSVALISHLDSTWVRPIINGVLAGLLTLEACIGIVILRVIPTIHKPTTLENVEIRIKEWLDNFGLSVKKEPIPEAHFRYIVETDGKLRIILGRLKNDLTSYIMLRVEIGPNDEEKQIISSLSDDERAIAMAQIKLELSRVGIGYTGFVLLDRGFSLTKRVPISSELTEDVLIRALSELEAAYHLVFITAALFMAQRPTKPQPKVLEIQ